MEETYVTAFSNLEYNGLCDLVECHFCGELMIVPTMTDVCPECGCDTDEFEVLDKDCTLDEIQRDYAIIWY